MMATRLANRTKDGHPVLKRGLVRGRMASLMVGELSVEDMDDEELARGQFKDKDGKFRGRPPDLIPREIHVKMKQELLRRGNQMFQEGYFQAIEIFLKVAQDTENDPAVRLKAAQYVIERIGGKTPDKVEITGDAPWQVLLNKIVLETSEGTVDVVDGTVIARRGQDASHLPEGDA